MLRFMMLSPAGRLEESVVADHWRAGLHSLPCRRPGGHANVAPAGEGSVMKTITKVLFAAAVAVAVIAVSAIPSEAQKGKGKQAAAKACPTPLMSCVSACQGAVCSLKNCGLDGKTTEPIAVRSCRMPDCPAKC
ncbi:MAG: hypothetical protein KIT76_06025 [Pseudolabrys sp.]|nr:hypothetical protein [Pseudolabrys sp.]